MGAKSLLRKRLLDPVASLLRQGISPRSLAWSLAVGFVVGCSPLLGLTTMICTALALWLRLNPVAINLVNWLVYPLQLLLFLPFLQLGSQMFDLGLPEASLSDILDWFGESPWLAFGRLGMSYLAAVLIWVLVALPSAFLTFKIIHAILVRMNLNRREQA